MSKLKLSPELALGYSEQLFSAESMINEQRAAIIAEMTQHGVIRKTTAFESFKVIQGAGAQLTILKGTAITNEGIPIILEADLVNHIIMEDEPVSYVVVLGYVESPIEKYKVNVQADGVVTMSSELSNTGFTRTNQTIDFGEFGFENKLRGISQFPTVICFPNSTVNTGEYIVNSVNSNSVLTLNVGEGVLNIDTDQEWAIVGTFTPGVVIPAADKFPFQYGSHKISLILTTEISLLDTSDQPELIRLGTVSYTAGVMTISDKRGINKYTKSNFI